MSLTVYGGMVVAKEGFQGWALFYRRPKTAGDRILLSMSVVDGPVVVVAMMGDMGIT